MRALGCLLAVIAVIAGGPARATSTVLVAGPGSFASTWSTPILVAQTSDQPTLRNVDIAFHGLEAVSTDSDDAPWCGPLNPGPEGPTNPRRYPTGDCPLFWADTVPPMHGSTMILGLDRVQPGASYAFHCSVFGNMRGLLLVAA